MKKLLAILLVTLLTLGVSALGVAAARALPKFVAAAELGIQEEGTNTEDTFKDPTPDPKPDPKPDPIETVTPDPSDTDGPGGGLKWWIWLLIIGAIAALIALLVIIF